MKYLDGMPATAVVWADPPAKAERAAKGDIARIADELRKNPGRWAKVSANHTQPSQAYKRRETYPDIEWEARRNDEGRYDIYGRFPTPVSPAPITG